MRGRFVAREKKKAWRVGTSSGSSPERGWRIGEDCLDGASGVLLGATFRAGCGGMARMVEYAQPGAGIGGGSIREGKQGVAGLGQYQGRLCRAFTGTRVSVMWVQFFWSGPEMASAPGAKHRLGPTTEPFFPSTGIRRRHRMPLPEVASPDLRLAEVRGGQGNDNRMNSMSVA